MKLSLLLLCCLMNVSAYSQYTLYRAQQTETCAGCHVAEHPTSTHKTISYQQQVLEEFQQTEFDTMYLIQYGVVSEVISMPINAISVSFYTNEGSMHAIISDRYYPSYDEAKKVGEQFREKGHDVCDYFIKPCLIAKKATRIKHVDQPVDLSKIPAEAQKANTVTRKVAFQHGDQIITRQFGFPAKSDETFRIQYSWTEDLPWETLEEFDVEKHNGGFRQISKQAFKDKAEATQWLQKQGYKLSDFWIYQL